jgi:hypothetical protein
MLGRYNTKEIDAEELRALKLWCGTTSIQTAKDCVTEAGN